MKADNAKYLFDKGMQLYRDTDFEAAAEHFRAAADMGCPEAQRRLGSCYRDGKGALRDDALALRWFKKAVDQGDRDAVFEIAALYSNGDLQDEVKADMWYEKAMLVYQDAAEYGDLNAQYSLACFYELGFFLPQDLTKAIYWYQKASEQGSWRASNALRRCYHSGHGVKKSFVTACEYNRKAFDLALKAAEGGDAWAALFIADEIDFEYYGYISDEYPEKPTKLHWLEYTAEHGGDLSHHAQKLLADKLADGSFGAPDAERADYWYHRAFEQLQRLARWTPGVLIYDEEFADCYANGKGVAKDTEKANALYQRIHERYLNAAESGEPYYQHLLGKKYENGNGVKKDMAQAVRWYQKAADDGYDEAKQALAYCYADGRGIERDTAKAVALLNEAGQSVAECLEEIADHYKYGDYPNDVSAAEKARIIFELYKKAVESGNADAQYDLAVCYHKGNGVSADERRAFELYRCAAEQGHHVAKRALAQCYEHGIGCAKDEKLAFLWYTRVAEVDAHRMCEANLDLARCYENGIGVEKNPDKALSIYQKYATRGYVRAKKKLANL